MNLVAAVDNHMGIGLGGRLLVSIPLDQQQFRKMTLGKVVVMGHRTLETLPQKQPLSGRTNIILSRNPSYSCRGALTAHSLEEALELLKGYDSKDIFIIGGESVFRAFLPLADTVYLTRIDYSYSADAHFPALPETEWTLTDISEEQTYFDLIYYFCVYRRIADAQETVRTS